MKYPEYKNLHYATLSSDILRYWQENKIFERSVSSREGQEQFVFFEGPPSANGTPGIHHVMARTIKDIFCRYKTLKGFQVKRKGGWDTHGLPVELQVEKLLGIKKEDIGQKISIEDYNQKCRETVMTYTDQWNTLTERMGYWVDLANPYITYEKNYIESLWHLLKKLHERGLLYKGYTIQPYSPAAGTGLSSHELNYPGTYQEVSDTSIVAQFKVKKDARSAFLFEQEDEEVFLLAWTTTPWTLPSNMALTVGEKINYVKVKTFNAYTHRPASVILAKALLPKYFSEKAAALALGDYQPGDKLIPYSIALECSGKELLDIRYEQLMPYIQAEEYEQKAFRVISGDFVSTEDGTGIVHTSPTFGADDARVAKQADVPAMLIEDAEGKLMPTVDREGRFVKAIGQQLKSRMEALGIKAHKVYGEEDFFVKNYLGEDEKQENYKSTDVIITIILKEENRAFKVEKYLHSYPHCWRTGKPVLYYPLDSWFIKTTALKERMSELNRSINWKPESTGSGRFGNWLDNLVDWNLSRSRYWGTPLPIWRSEDGSEEKCIGSVAELVAEAAKATAAGFANPENIAEIDLHRPYVDRIVLLSDTGKPMYRETDLIDVWFDSGAMPYAQWHYPFENLEMIEQGKAFPADFISEGVDQTRGWFFTLHALSVMLFDKVAFKNVVSTGLVLDKNGEKMSKSKGNVIDPFQTLDQYGADATRWYMVENANPWDNLKFDLEGIGEVQRRFFGTLYNTYNFFALYANLDQWKAQDSRIAPAYTELDLWILSKLQSLILEVESAYEDYEPTKAARAIQDFVCEQLSNWYVRLGRRRFWKGEMTADKQAAYQTLYECLRQVAGLMSPIAPFFADWLYQNLQGEEASVHLSRFPKAQKERIDAALEQRMDLAQRICSLTHSLRKKEKVKVRQPLSRILVPVLQENTKAQIALVEDLIKAEVNVKNIEYIDDTSGVLVKSIKPNFKRLGEIYKAKMKEVAAIIQNFTKDDIAKIEREGLYEAEISEGFITLTLEDVLIEAKEIAGWSVATEQGLTVALDIHISEELRQEGIARDFINRIQNLRKDRNLDVVDKISLRIAKSEESLVNEALQKHQAYICEEVQALQFALVEGLSDKAAALDMDTFTLQVEMDLAG
jgi:isoleucyl-tRNA synthetase